MLGIGLLLGWWIWGVDEMKTTHIPNEKDLPKEVEPEGLAVCITYRKIIGYNEEKEPIYCGYVARYSKESAWKKE